MSVMGYWDAIVFHKQGMVGSRFYNMVLEGNHLPTVSYYDRITREKRIWFCKKMDNSIQLNSDSTL